MYKHQNLNIIINGIKELRERKDKNKNFAVSFSSAAHLLYILSILGNKHELPETSLKFSESVSNTGLLSVVAKNCDNQKLRELKGEGVKIVCGEDPQQNLKYINQNIMEATNDLIEGSLLEEEIKPFAVISVVYFKGSWNLPFDKESTIRVREFTTSSGDIKKVDTMTKTFHVKQRYTDIIVLSFTDGAYACIAKASKYEDVDYNLFSLCNEIHRQTTSFLVELFLPKFKIKYKIEDISKILDVNHNDFFEVEKYSNFSIVSRFRSLEKP